MRWPPSARASSLRTRIGLVALVFLGLVLIAAGLSALMVRAWNQNLDARADMRAAAEDVAELRIAYTEQETGLRGYQLSGDTVSLDPYEAGQTRAQRSLARLGARPVEVAGFDAQLAAVAEAANAWRTEVAEPTIADLDDAPSDEVARVRFDLLRSELEQLDRVVADELAELEARTDRVRRTTFAVLLASAAAAIIGTALVTVLFRRWVIEPLEQVSDAARALAIDDTAILPDADTPELADVHDAIRSLQTSLVSARDDAIRAYGALEQSAVLAVQVRSELADEIGELPAGWSAQSLLQPAEGVVAGDCFDVGLLDREHLYVVMIDVTGHGAGAALDALKAKGQLRAALRSRLEPGAAIEWLSRETRRDEATDLLTTAVLIVDLTTGECRYANAGHPPMIVTDGTDHHRLDPTGPLVGAFPATWTTERATIPPGWLLVVHTDGVTETVGHDRERFGDERLLTCLDPVEPRQVIEQLRSAVEEFREGSRSDDLTVIVLRRDESAVPVVPGGRRDAI